jgi:two-component system sensor histidine kinase ChiS
MMQQISEKDRLLSNLDQMKNEYIANITHDFRSLVGIIMDSSWLGMEADEGRSLTDVRELCSIAYETSLKLKVAIDRLLDLASMDERGLVLRIRKVGMRSFLTGLAAFYRPVLSVSGISLEEEFPAREVENLFTDADKVEQIMHNLISNAAKFVERGSGKIAISLVDREDSIQIAVTDDGAGIPRDQLGSIFVRFKRIDGGRGRQSGTGIGLAFVKELASYLRGSIAVESEGPGRGSRFVLTLRKGKDLFDGVEMSEEVEDPAHAIIVRNQFRRILEANLRERPLRVAGNG